jgi:hypothetical protein
MPSSDARFVLAIASALAVALVSTRTASAQPANGFAVERYYPSAPGAGWLVMDTLDMHGELGGAFSAVGDYASAPLRITEGGQQLAVVSREAMLDIGAAVTHQWWRLYLNLDSPLVLKGESGTLGTTTFAAPSVDLSSHPDAFADARLGFDARLIGDASSSFRAGAGAQLLIPIGTQADYDTDGTYRAMVRGLIAGDVGRASYAAQLGVHVRPLNDADVPGSPRGSELLFGAAGGVRTRLGSCTDVVVGPELFGATAFRSLFAAGETSLEALLSARVEGMAGHGMQVRIKLGVGAGLATSLGTPAWRAVVGVEAFNRSLLKRVKAAGTHPP